MVLKWKSGRIIVLWIVAKLRETLRVAYNFYALYLETFYSKVRLSSTSKELILALRKHLIKPFLCDKKGRCKN